MPAGARSGRTPLLVVVDPRRRRRLDAIGSACGALRCGADWRSLYPTQSGGFWSLNHAQGDGDLDAVARPARAHARGRLLRRAARQRRPASPTAPASRRAWPASCRGASPASRPSPRASARSTRARRATRASLLAIHGTADTVVPYNGKRPGREGSVPRFARALGRASRAARRPRASRRRAPCHADRLPRRATRARASAIVRLTGIDARLAGARDPGASRSATRRAFAPRPRSLRFALGVRGR